MIVERARIPLGLAAAVVPFAIGVHLVAEALSLGRGELGLAFLIRHLYLGVILLATMTCFARTVGVGSAPAERRRRCALIAARLRADTAGAGLASFALANLLFFGASQLVEGVPIASGDWCLGFAAAILGSLVSTILVVLFGRSMVAVALIVSGLVARRAAALAAPSRTRRWVIPRRAAAMFSLSMPNRPPPRPSLA